MLYQWSILLLVTVQNGLTSESFDVRKLCTDQNLTLPLSRMVQRRQAVVTSDPFPARAITTCNIRVNFDAAATVNLTLTTVNFWKTLNPSTKAQGYVIERINGEEKFVHRSNIPERSSAWTNASSKPCPYLFVWRASAPDSNGAVQSIFNESTTLNATGIVIELRNIPETAWCEIRININASPIPEDYCQGKDELYCNASAQCISANLRCNRHRECDNGEDEMDCSEDGFTEGLSAERMAVSTYVSLSVAICVVILLMVAIAVVLRRRRLKRLRRKDKSYDYSIKRQAGASCTEAKKLSILIDNDMYSPSPQLPESLKVSPAEPVYHTLECQFDRPSTSYVKNSE